MEINYKKDNYIDSAYRNIDDISYSDLAKKYFYFQRYNILAGYRRSFSPAAIILQTKQHYDDIIKNSDFTKIKINDKIFDQIELEINNK